MIGAFPESKIAPHCKKKKRDYKVISLLLKLTFHKVLSLLIHNIYVWLHSLLIQRLI